MAKQKIKVVNRVMETETTYMTCAFKGYSGHKGVDLVPKSTSETPYILAFADGEVIATGNVNGTNSSTGTAGCGTFVAIRHKDGTITRYQHLKYNSLRVKKGSIVKRGQILGVYGRPTTGNSSGSHLHFDVSLPERKDNDAIYGTFCGEARYYVNPLPYLDGSYKQPKLYKVLRDVNIRDNPSVSGSKVIGEFKKGEVVTAIELKGSWIRTTMGWSNNNNGYYFKPTK